MSDFEDRLTDSLRAVGGDAPAAAGLARAARGRARARRRRTALASAAGVLAVAAVAGGVALLGSGDDGPSRVAADPTPSPTPRSAGTRVETWHDVSVTVPADWGHGPLSTWCLQDPDQKAGPGIPVVERSGGVVAMIACTPTYGYGVRFSEAQESSWEAYAPGTVDRSVGEEFPAGSWQGYDVVHGIRVQVVAPTQAEAEAVLGSVQQVDGVDAHGCAPRLPGIMSPPATGVVRLCRYADDGWLEQSETLTGQDAAAASAALSAAPTRAPRRCPEAAVLAGVQVWSEDLSATVRLDDGCPGVFGWGEEERDLTGDVLHWVLSPGWTGVVPDGITFDPRS